MKLSIIIPYYDTWEYTEELLNVLLPQLTDEVEVLIIDDGCNEKRLDKYPVKVIHLDENSGTASVPRNVGLDHATGDYIAFIDSDDMISEDYIQKVLSSLTTDIIFLSWRNKIRMFRIGYKPPYWNCSVWCRVYKRSIIGKTRFDENLKIAEDWKFNEQITYRTFSSIKDVVYIYNNGRKGSILNGDKE